MSKPEWGIIYVRYRIPVNYGIAVETSVIHTKSQVPSFLVDEHDGMIVLRFIGLHPDFL